MIQKIRLDGIGSVITNKIDLFICCSSFEKRCKTIPIEVAKLKPAKSVVFFNHDFNKKIKKNAKKLKKILRSDRSSKHPISINDSLFTYKSIYNILKLELKDPKNNYIVVDITTFTHESLLLLLKLIVLLKKEDQVVEFLYNGAKEYSFKQENITDKWLTKGVKSSRTIIGYPGVTDLTLKDHLLILFGFEKDRTNRVIQNFEYNFITLAFGKEGSSIRESHFEINKKRHKELIDLYKDVNGLEVCLNDPDLTKEDILKYIDEIEENIVIMPMNNKLSTVGVGLAALKNRKIQLYYSLASRYNTEGYSKPSKDVFFYKLDTKAL